MPELSRIGTLSKIDVNAFVRYCINLHEWRTCVDFLLANGTDLVTHNEEGEVTGVVPYPHTKRKRELEILLLRYEQSEFGLTPTMLGTAREESRSSRRYVPERRAVTGMSLYTGWQQLRRSSGVAAINPATISARFADT